MTTQYASIVLLVGAALLLGACGSKAPTLSVGSKNTSEQLILGEIVAAQLERRLPGVKVERKLGLGATTAVQGAIQTGDIDLYVEDLGTMLGTVLKEDVPADESVGLERARAQYQLRYQLTVLKPLGFHHQFVVVTNSSGASGIKTDNLTAVGDSHTGFKLGVAYDLYDRKDAFTALTTKYRISMRELPLRMEPAAMYQALLSGSIDLAAGYSTDSWTDQPGFKLLKDDRDLFPKEPACVVIRNQTLISTPGLDRALEALSGIIKDGALRKLNQEVDLRHRKPDQLAKEFLASVGL